jgi:hypothetical protein
MKTSLGIIFLSFLILSCEPTYHANRGNSTSSQPRTSVPEPKTSEVSDSYESLIKTYKPETAEVLSDLLNGTSDSPRTSIIIDNKSNCNLVVTVKGGNILKKIPATKGKLSYIMIEKNQNYTISGNLCGKNFKQSARIYDSYTITLK